MDSELQAGTSYVGRLRAKGQTDAEISKRLQAGGWPPDLVRELFAEVGPYLPEETVTEGRAEARTTVAYGYPTWWCSNDELDRDLYELLSNSVKFVITYPDGSQKELKSDPSSRSKSESRPLCSPNGEFCLYMDWGENTEQNVLLLTGNGRVQWRANVGRSDPLQCALSDTGYVVVSADTPTDSLTGDIFVFAPTGERILKKRLSACIDCCGLSEASDLAWCLTLMNPDNESHSHKLFVFALNPPGQLFKVDKLDLRDWDMEVGLIGDQVVFGGADGGLQYRYSLKGKLLNAQEIEQARLSNAFRDRDGEELLAIVEARLKATDFGKMPAEEQGLTQALLGRASGCQIGDYAKAKAQRHLGEMALFCGNKERAISHFRQAVAFDPKVGVKKRLQALEKDVSTESERHGAGNGDGN